MNRETNRWTLSAVVAATMMTIASAQGPGFPPQGGGPGGPGGPQHGPGRGPGRPMGGPAILMRPEIREELRLTEDQVQRLHDALPRPQPGQRISREEMQKVESAIKGILNATQYRRYQQISLQMQGPGALGRPDIAQQLGLSEDQVEKIREILQRHRPPMPPGGPGGPGGPGRPGGPGGPGGPGHGGPPAGGPGGPPPGGPGGPGGPGEEMRRKVDQEIMAVLTADQRDKWKAMLGEPFRPRRRE